MFKQDKHGQCCDMKHLSRYITYSLAYVLNVAKGLARTYFCPRILLSTRNKPSRTGDSFQTNPGCVYVRIELAPASKYSVTGVVSLGAGVSSKELVLG
jgi:hypothetical protein